MLNEYGDDSVAQLGGAHVACEGVSNILTKVLEWGRLMAYLEQSTRYVPYTDRPNGRWKYHVPAEVARTPLAADFTATLDFAFETYARWIPALEAHFRAKYPKSPDDSDGVYRSVIRAKALDTLRGLLPAATTSNVGIYGTGQAYEALHPPDVRASARRGARVRRPAARRTAPGDARVPRARRSAGPRRTLDSVSRDTRESAFAAVRRARRDASTPNRATKSR